MMRGLCGRALRGLATPLPRMSVVTSHMMSSNTQETADIVIAGGGMVGCSAAVALANLGCMKNKKIVLLEAAPDKEIKISKEFSNRVSALAPSTVSLLTSLGVWPLIEAEERAGQVMRMRIWDGCSKAGITFSSEDYVYDMDRPLNHIVENDVTVKAINEVVRSHDNISVRYSTKVKKYNLPTLGENDVVPDKNVLVELEDGSIIETPLLVGADGFRSLVRQSIASDYVSWEYQQMGLVATLDVETHTRENVTAWQRFLPTGPVALLPLTSTKSSLVWTLDTRLTRAMAELEPDIFITRLNTALTSNQEHDSLVTTVTDRFSDFLKVVSPRSGESFEPPPTVTGVANRAAFPLGFGHSHRYIGPRTILIGDAAHRVHPLAGQGVNLGFGDVISLASCVEDSLREGGRLGQRDYLAQYETERLRHNLTTMMGIDGLQRLYCSDWTPLVMARSLGLMATEACDPVKKMFMKHAA